MNKSALTSPELHIKQETADMLAPDKPAELTRPLIEEVGDKEIDHSVARFQELCDLLATAETPDERMAILQHTPMEGLSFKQIETLALASLAVNGVNSIKSVPVYSTGAEAGMLYATDTHVPVIADPDVLSEFDAALSGQPYHLNAGNRYEGTVTETFETGFHLV
ncbi:MAG TPA: hypothetical protein VG604_02705 [Candidatus Saccharimonadales bacterium]|nr:hypothetical protein [Candidatus Saccharimonadales bacterium]